MSCKRQDSSLVLTSQVAFCTHRIDLFLPELGEDPCLPLRECKEERLWSIADY